MISTALPSRAAAIEAVHNRDASYDGVFVTAVRTTGIFCRPTCPARRPRPEHLAFFAGPREALLAGYRPCKRCRPMEPRGAAPEWLRPLLARVEADPAHRWTDADVRVLGFSPRRVRRWFQTHYGLTFHGYSRARRLGLALGQIQQGNRVTRAAFSSGFDSLSGFHDAFRRTLGTNPSAAKEQTVVTLSRIPTPLGPLVVGATAAAVCLLEFTDRRMLETQMERLRHRLDGVLVPGVNPLIEATAAELDAYFAGQLREFTIPIATPGTAFQRAVWDLLRQIPYGATTTYGALARRLGRPAATRAVARANGDNRLAVVIPCHRVVGANGKLTGYGGGLWRKRRLLALESGSALALDAPSPVAHDER